MASLPKEIFEALQAINEVAFANPYSGLRPALDKSILQSPSNDPDKLVDQLIHFAEDLYAALAKRGPTDIRRYSGQEREVLRVFILFVYFHRARHEFDAHIREQAKLFDKTLPAPFASRIVGELSAHGISATEAERLVAILFQVRRAFFYLEEIKGTGPSISRLRSNLWNNIFTKSSILYERGLWNHMEDFSTLILGKTGTGKTQIASAIGRSSYIPFSSQLGRFVENFNQVFVAVNLSQYPVSLMESALFGHRKGAFTGATENSQGVFARSGAHGVIFIDEVGEIDLPTQVKLLNVLQDRIYYPVGGQTPQHFRGRVIAATNRPLPQLMAEGKFREDLFYRLCSDIIEVPTLGQRIKEDPKELAILTRVILTSKVKVVDDEVIEKTVATITSQLGATYDWPGNIRELEQMIRRTIMHGTLDNHPNSDSTSNLSEERPVREVIQDYLHRLYARHGSLEKVAQIADMDPRTVRKHLGTTLGTSVTSTLRGKACHD